MWIRSAMAYRATFAMMTLVQFVTTALDFVAIWFMFGLTRQLGGFSLPEIALLYGASCVAIALADLFVGGIEQIGQRIRDGSLDTMLVRPVAPYVQAIADRFAPRRIGRLAQATAVLVWGLVAVGVHWTAGRVAMVPVMIVCGAVIFGGIFTLGGAFQFVATDAAEVSNAFTYGGNAMTEYPPTIYAKEIVRAAMFTIPLAFVNWLPALYILGRPAPAGTPDVLRFASPVAALALSAVAALAWKAGVRSYRSTGS
ncbi:MAG: ABC-2 family transporter protein [Streptosporangiales bacterium]|nr:ABC-2 family transporter protein [Streptosporangiales bacterium]